MLENHNTKFQRHTTKPGCGRICTITKISLSKCQDPVLRVWASSIYLHKNMKIFYYVYGGWAGWQWFLGLCHWKRKSHTTLNSAASFPLPIQRFTKFLNTVQIVLVGLYNSYIWQYLLQGVVYCKHNLNFHSSVQSTKRPHSWILFDPYSPSGSKPMLYEKLEIFLLSASTTEKLIVFSQPYN